MKKFRYLRYVFLSSLLVSSMISCNNDDLDGYTAKDELFSNVEPFLKPNPESLTFDAKGGEETIEITSNTSWAVKSNSEEWCIIKGESSGNGNGIVVINVTKNTTSAPARDATITISYSSKKYIISVHQDKGAGPDKDIPSSGDNPNPSY